MASRNSLPCVIESRLPDKGGRKRVLRYELLSVLGQGGMATVYLANDLTPPDWYREANGDKPRRVVLKYPHEEVLQISVDALDRFVREANLLKSVNHPNVVRIWNMGVDQDTHPFIVMELVEDAQSLDALKAKYWENFLNDQGKSENGKIERSLVPVSMLVPLLRQVLDALEALHAKNIVHRDIKPENILVTDQDGRDVVKLTDLGISKNLTPQPGPSLTSQGVIVGTPYYMSPEAAMECKIHPVTRETWYVGPYSDFWSLGASAFELVTGFLPFDADANELRKPTNGARSEIMAEQLMARLVLAKVVDSQIGHRDIKDFVHDPNPHMVEFIDLCLIKDPWDRPKDATALRKLLDKAEEWERRHKLPFSLPGKSTSWREADSLAPTRELVSNPPPQTPAVSSEVTGRSRLSRIKVAWVPAAILAFGTLVLLAWLFDLHGRFYDSRPALQDSAAASGSFLSSTAPPVASTVSPATATASAKRTPGSGPEPGSRAYGIYRSGVSAYAAGNCSQAKRFMNGVLAVHPSFPPAMKVLGECALRGKRFDEARQYLELYQSFDGVEPLSAEAQKFLAR